jgi:hypothetical protein
MFVNSLSITHRLHLLQVSGQFDQGNDHETMTASLPGFRMGKRISRSDVQGPLQVLIDEIEARIRLVEGPGDLEQIYILATQGAQSQVLHSDQRLSIEY